MNLTRKADRVGWGQQIAPSLRVVKSLASPRGEDAQILGPLISRTYTLTPSNAGALLYQFSVAVA